MTQSSALYRDDDMFHVEHYDGSENVKKSVRVPVFIDAPAGFALRGRKDYDNAKRVYETPKTGRARDARQELHHAGRPRAPQG